MYDYEIISTLPQLRYEENPPLYYAKASLSGQFFGLEKLSLNFPSQEWT